MKYYKKLDIIRADILPSDIIYIEFHRPRDFQYKSGQWVTVSSPSISCTFNESHAFSIASAPQDENVKLYIKAVGPWTWKLRSELLRAQNTGSPYPLIHLRGPYGDGNQEWMNYEVAIMVGGGIGVTPYASTLNDLVQLTSSDSFHRVKCRKVYFLWVCPSHKNYEWFVDVLKNVEEQARPGILETHIFVTQLFHKFDLRTTMLVRKCITRRIGIFCFSTSARSTSAHRTRECLCSQGCMPKTISVVPTSKPSSNLSRVNTER